MTMRPSHLANPAAFVWSYDQNDRLIAACACTERAATRRDAPEKSPAGMKVPPGGFKPNAQ